jgi:hypothetical protein
MSDDLIKWLQYLGRVAKDYDQEHMTSADYEMIPAVTKQAAYRIEELEERNKERAQFVFDAGGQAADTLDKLEKAVEALRELHHAVCGGTGFAQAVRMESGKAYPWPALDKADDAVLAVLTELEGGE